MGRFMICDLGPGSLTGFALVVVVPQGQQVPSKILYEVLGAPCLFFPILRPLLLHPRRPRLHPRTRGVAVEPHELRVVHVADFESDSRSPSRVWDSECRWTRGRSAFSPLADPAAAPEICARTTPLCLIHCPPWRQTPSRTSTWTISSCKEIRAGGKAADQQGHELPPLCK
uniref:Uncharacterized protein n=1 Tax=Equus caballus TaxID=9796 RepID=A0A9L0RBT9_HORSE